MQRRRFVANLGSLSAIGLSGISIQGQPSPESGNYAESVAMTAHSADAMTTFDVRIARFPTQRKGSVWIYAYVDERQYSLVDDDVQLSRTGMTPIAAADAEFGVTGSSRALLRGANRYSADMTGSLDATGMTHLDAHPAPGTGETPLSIRAQFAADHLPVNVRPGRLEVMGHVTATIESPFGEYQLSLPGKWHEQSGERAQFAPAFTYLFVQGPGIGLMCTKHTKGAWGYLFDHGNVEAISAMTIEPYGQSARGFEVHLANGSRFLGTATVVREVSVPIEGRRRPGATVIVASNFGEMVGVLNDWNPG